MANHHEIGQNEQNPQLEIAISPMASRQPSGLSSRQLSSVPPVAFHDLQGNLSSVPLHRHHSHHLQYSQQLSSINSCPNHSRGVVRAQSMQIVRNPMYFRSERDHQMDGYHETHQTHSK